MQNTALAHDASCLLHLENFSMMLLTKRFRASGLSDSTAVFPTVLCVMGGPSSELRALGAACVYISCSNFHFFICVAKCEPNTPPFENILLHFRPNAFQNIFVKTPAVRFFAQYFASLKATLYCFHGSFHLSVVAGVVALPPLRVETNLEDRGWKTVKRYLRILLFQ